MSNSLTQIFRKVRFRILSPITLIAALLIGALPAHAAVAAEPDPAQAAVTNQTLFLPAVAQDPAAYCRFGVNKDIDTVNIAPLRAGWYLNYSARTRATSIPRGVEYFLTIRLTQPDPNTDDFEYSISANWAPTTEEMLLNTIRNNPGAHVFIGNEPDRRDRKVGGQDAIEPRVYALAYQHLYNLIKGVDDSTIIIAGSIVQPTELRLRYLDRVLAEYRSAFGAPMPVDAWAIHNFILNEQRDNWGADIPPGFDDVDEGMVITDVDDIVRVDIFAEQIRRFRIWMANNGYRNTPLYVSEYGVLFPVLCDLNDDGILDECFPQFDPPAVNQFMNQTFDYMLNAIDPNIGYPADNNRLVQRFSWYSIYDKGFNGNLFTETNAISEIGSNYAAYTARLHSETDFFPVSFTAVQNGDDVVLTARIANSGNVATEHYANVRFYVGDPAAGGVQVGSTTPIRIAGCGENHLVETTWENAGPGPHSNLYVAVEPIRATRETNHANNQFGPVSVAASFTSLPMNVIADPASIPPATGP